MKSGMAIGAEAKGMVLGNELRAVFFLWKREMLRMRRSKSRMISQFGMPLLFFLILGTGLNGAFAVSGAGTNYLEFMAPGIILMTILFGSFFSGMGILIDRQFGFLKETLIAPVSRPAIVIGKALGGATDALFKAAVMLAVTILLGVHINLLALPALAVAVIIISISIVSIGMMFGSVMEDMQGFPIISNLVIMPLFFLSGALFPLESSPAILRTIAAFNPFTYAVETMRFALFGESYISIALSLPVTAAFMLATVAIAAYLFSRIEE